MSAIWMKYTDDDNEEDEEDETADAADDASYPSDLHRRLVTLVALVVVHIVRLAPELLSTKSSRCANAYEYEGIYVRMDMYTEILWQIY